MSDTLTIQDLINTGAAWSFEGHVGRQCMAALESGLAVLGAEPQRDYWGNGIPARHQVVEGTKGSVTYALAQLQDTMDWADEEELEQLDEIRANILSLECPSCVTRYDFVDEGCDTCAPVKELL